MPLVYACICPHPPVIVPQVGRGREAEAPRTVGALGRVARELAGYEPETVLLVSSHGPVQSAHGQMGILTAPNVQGDLGQFGAPEVRFAFETDQDLAARIQEEAAKEDVRLEPLRHWYGGLDWGCTVPLHHLSAAGGLDQASLLPMTPSRLEPHFHFELGRAIGRALDAYDRRVVFVCSADLSHALSPEAPERYDPAGRVFDERYRRAIEEWDVKWLVSLDSSFRAHAAEDAAAQTAILMGALSSSRIQPRILSYEAPFGVGYLVAAIDIVGPRRAAKTRTNPQGAQNTT